MTDKHRPFMPYLIFIVAAFIICAASITSFAQNQDSKDRIAPHKALYEIRLAGTKSGSQIINVAGQMLYEVKPNCEAWVSNHRFKLKYDYADTPSIQVTSDFSTFESYDGESFNFTSQRKRNGELFEELRGHADMSESEGGLASYKIPRGLEYELPDGTLFPMRHTMEIIDHARAGKKFYTTTIFDGSDEEGPVEVTAFIGEKANMQEGLKNNENIDENLLARDGHKVRLAFFPLKSGSSESDYEMDLVFHDNGVIGDMFIEYDDFSVTQKLIALESIPHGCEENKE